MSAHDTAPWSNDWLTPEDRRWQRGEEVQRLHALPAPTIAPVAFSRDSRYARGVGLASVKRRERLVIKWSLRVIVWSALIAAALEFARLLIVLVAA